MSTNISANTYQFILKEINYSKIATKDAYQYGLSAEEINEADVNDDGYIDLDELEDADEVLAKLAVVVEQKEEKNDVQESEEDKKKKETQVKNKNETGV